MATVLVFTERHPNNPWVAYCAAEKWCAENGYSIGTMQRGSPTAVFKGDCAIAKWRSLSIQERALADGTITTTTGTFRDSDVTLTLK